MLKEDEDETLTFEIIDFTMENKKNLVKIQQKKNLLFKKSFNIEIHQGEKKWKIQRNYKQLEKLIQEVS